MAPGPRKPLLPSTRLPSDDELIVFVTEPMTSIAVARHFGLSGPACLKRMRKLADRGRLARPCHGTYAPAGMLQGPRPLTGRSAEVLAVLDQPRTAAEVGALTGIGRRATHVLELLRREGRAVHCGPSHFLRAELAGRFEPREGLSRLRSPPEKGLILRERVMILLAEPRGADEITRLLGAKKHQVDYMLGRLIREGRVSRVVRAGYRQRYLYSRAEPG